MHKTYLDGRTAWGTKGAYAVSLSAESRWAFWKSFSTAWKSFASLASATFLLAWNYIEDIQVNHTKKKKKKKRKTK